MNWLYFVSHLLLLPAFHCLKVAGSNYTSSSNTVESIYQQTMREKKEYIQKVLNLTDTKPLKVVAVVGNFLDTFDFSQITNLLSYIPNVEIKTIAPTRDPITAIDGVTIVPDLSYNDDFEVDILTFVAGTGPNPATSAFVKKIEHKVKKHIFTVCQGSMSIAAAGILDGRKATVTKVFYSVTKILFPKVNWIAKARWVDQGKIITTSGAAAGLDGVLFLISKLYGVEAAKKIAMVNEYEWASDPNDDPFSDIERIYNPLIPNFSL